MRRMRSQSVWASPMSWVLMITAAPAVALLAHDALEHVGVDRVETLEGLVDDEQVGVVEDGGDELRLLVHAARELGRVLVGGIAEAHLVEQPLGPRRASDSDRPRRAPK